MEMTTEPYRSESEVKYNLARADGVELIAKKIYCKALQKDISVRPSEREVMVESVSSSTTEHSLWRTLERHQGGETCHSPGKMLEAKAVSKKLSKEEKRRHSRTSYSEESETRSQSSRKHSSSGGEKSVRGEHHGLDSSFKRSVAPQHSTSTKKLSEREAKRTEPEVSSSSLVLTPLRHVTPPPPRISTQAGIYEKRLSSLSYKERERSSNTLNTFKRRDSSNTKSSKDENKPKKFKEKDKAARKEKNDRHGSTHRYGGSEKSISNAKMVEMQVRKIRNSLEKKSREDLDTKESSTSKPVHSKLRCKQDRGLRNTHEEDTQLTPFLPSSRCCSPPPRPTVVTKYWSDADETEDESDCEKHMMHVNSVNIVLNYLKAHQDKYYRKGRVADSQAMYNMNGHPKRRNMERLTLRSPLDSQRRVRRGNHVRKWRDSDRGRGMHSRYPASQQHGSPHEEDRDLPVRGQYDHYSRSHSPLNGLSGVIGLIASLTDQQYMSPPRHSEQYERGRSLSPMTDHRRHCYRSRSPLDSQSTQVQQHRSPPSPLRHGDSRSRQLQSAYRDEELHSPWHKRRFLTRESHSPLRHRSDPLRNRSHSPSGDRDSPLRYRGSHSPFSYRDHSLRDKEACSPSRFRVDHENSWGLQSPFRYSDDHVNTRRSQSPSWYRDDHVNSRRSRSRSRYIDNHVRGSLSRSASKYRESSLRNRESRSPSSYRGDSLKDRMSQPSSKYRSDCVRVRDSYLGGRGSRSPSRHRGDSLMDRKLQEESSLREMETLAPRDTEFSPLMHERSSQRSPELRISHNQLKKPRFSSELSQRDCSRSPSHRNHSQSPPGIFCSYSESDPRRHRSRSNEKNVLPPWHRERKNIGSRLSPEFSNTSLAAGNTGPSVEREQSFAANIRIKQEKESCDKSDYFFNSAVGNTDEDYQKGSVPCTERYPIKKGEGQCLSDPMHPDYAIMPRAFNANTQGECIPKTKIEVITICDEPIIDRPEGYLKDSSIVSISHQPSFVPDVYGSQVSTGSTESSEPFALPDRAPGPSGISNVASSGRIDVEEPLYYLSDSDHDPDLENLGNLSEVSSLIAHHEAVTSDKTPPNTGSVAAVPVEQEGVTTENTRQDKEKASLTLNSAEMSTLLNLIEIAKEHTATGSDLSANLPMILERIRQNTNTSNVSESSDAQNRGDESQSPNTSHVSGGMQDSTVEAESSRRNTSDGNVKNDEERNGSQKDDEGLAANSPNKEKQVPKGKVCKTDTKRKLSETKDSSKSQQSKGKGKVQVGNASEKPSAGGRLSESKDSSKGPPNIIKLPAGKANNKPAKSEELSKTKDDRKFQQSGNKCQMERSQSKASEGKELTEAKDNSKAQKSRSTGVEKSSNKLSGSEETQVQSRKKIASDIPPLERTIKKGEQLKNKGDLKETLSTNNPDYRNQNKKETKDKKSSIIQNTFANMQNVSIYVGDLSASQKSVAQSRRGKPYNIMSPKKTPFRQVGERSFVRDHSNCSSDPKSSEAKKGTDTLSASASSPQKVHLLHQETIVVDHSVNLCRACKNKLIPDVYTSISLSTGTVTMRCRTCHTFTRMEKVMPLDTYNKTSNPQKAALQKKSPCIKTPSVNKPPVKGKNDISKETNVTDDGQNEIQRKTERPPDTNKEVRKEKKSSQGIQTAKKAKPATQISTKLIEKLPKSVYHEVATQSTSVSKTSQGGEGTTCKKRRTENKKSTSINRDKDSQLNEDTEASPNSFDTIDPNLLVFPWGSSRKRKKIHENLSVNDDSSGSDEEDITNRRRMKLTKRKRIINSSSSSEDSDDDTSAHPNKSTRTVTSITDTKANTASKSNGTT